MKYDCEICKDEGEVWERDSDPLNGQGGDWVKCVCQIKDEDDLEELEVGID